MIRHVSFSRTKPGAPFARELGARSWPLLVRTGTALPVLLLAGLAGCAAPVQTSFPPSCPHVAILPETADLSLYRPSGRDLTDMVLDGRITGVGGDCTREDPHTLTVTARASMQLTRGPAARGRLAPVPIFFAITENGQLLYRQIYNVMPQFAANSDSLTLTTDDVTLPGLPISPGKPGSAYDLWIGFELTPQGIAYNRSRLQR
ncbi:MAG: hypothetical protein J2P47_09470 [Acetobacteraceae bacterium]|nr:hypothetical protein [Acetobacteraceae bacterium]